MVHNLYIYLYLMKVPQTNWHTRQNMTKLAHLIWPWLWGWSKFHWDSVVSDIIMVYILANSTNHFFLLSSHQIGLTPELNKVRDIASAVPVSSVRSACTVSHQLQCQSRRWDPIGYQQTVVVAWWISTLPTPAENAESFYAFPAFSGMLHQLHCSRVKVHK